MLQRDVRIAQGGRRILLSGLTARLASKDKERDIECPSVRIVHMQRGLDVCFWP